MKVQINLNNFNDDVLPHLEDNTSNGYFSQLIPMGKLGIHIKKKNRGSFTSYCGGKVTDACIQKGKNSSNPVTRKRATFADNARKWKHQEGGSLIPGINYKSISNLFVDTDQAPVYDPKSNKKSKKDNVDPLLQDLSVYQQPKRTYDLSSIYNNSIEDHQEEPWYNTVYHEYQPSSKTPSISHDRLMAAITPHLGFKGSLGHYDCSNFVSRVLGDLGYNLSGNCRTLYANTDRVDLSDLRVGDLVFKQDTQGDKVPHGQASHVAIVTDVSRLGEGIIQVAQGSASGSKTQIMDWNLNNMSNYFGAGRIRKGKQGFKFQLGGLLTSLPTPQRFSPDNFFESENEISNEPLNISFQIEDVPPLFEQKRQQQQALTNNEEDNAWYTRVYAPKKKKSKLSTPSEKHYSVKGYNFFKQEFDKYLSIDPSAKKYEQVLTDIANRESRFNFGIQNTAGAPAYGCFQFWQDGKINNITHYSGLSVDEFLNNPQAQIAAAVKLARDIEKRFNSEDLRIADARGYDMNALIKGAWLGGIGGVRKVLRGLGNPSDSKWYGGKSGASVKQVMES